MERIESAKARERMEAGVSNPSLNSDKGRTDNIVAKKLGIGGKDTYNKEKYIVDHKDQLSPEDFAEWDESKLSTNKAYQRIKEKLRAKESEIVSIAPILAVECQKSDNRSVIKVNIPNNFVESRD